MKVVCTMTVSCSLPSGSQDTPDPSAMPLPQPARGWVWLVDLERTCSLVVGRFLGGMLDWLPVSKEEIETQQWLKSKLLSKGLERDMNDCGESFNLT